MIPIVSPMYLLIAYRRTLSHGAMRLLLESLFGEAFLVVLIVMCCMQMYKDKEGRGLIMLFSIPCLVLLGIASNEKAAWNEIGSLHAFPRGYLYTWLIIEIVASATALIVMIGLGAQNDTKRYRFAHLWEKEEPYTDALPPGVGYPGR